MKIQERYTKWNKSKTVKDSKRLLIPLKPFLFLPLGRNTVEPPPNNSNALLHRITRILGSGMLWYWVLKQFFFYNCIIHSRREIHSCDTDYKNRLLETDYSCFVFSNFRKNTLINWAEILASSQIKHHEHKRQYPRQHGLSILFHSHY